MSDDPVARALADAGPRTLPPAEMHAQVRSAVQQAWVEELSRRRRGRQRRWLAAASVLLALGAALTFAVRMRAPQEAAAMLLASRGAVGISGNRTSAATAGGALGAGTSVRTGTDGMALLAMGAASLRIGPDSELTLQSAGNIRLGRGRVFLDFAARDGQPQELLLQTPLGKVEHLGTQFQVQVDERQMSVLVREGRVRITTAAGEQLLGEREAAEIDGDGRTRVHATPAFGAAWEWTGKLHPDFPIEGVTLADFLDWFTRETGRPVRYATPAARAAARTTRLSGSIAGLSAQEAITAVIASTQFVLEPLPSGELQVGLRTAAASAPHAKLDADGAEVLTARTAASN